MSHENLVTEGPDDIGMWHVRPSSGKFADNRTSSYITSIAEFDNQEEADAYAKEWSDASYSVDRRNFLLDKHKLHNPEYWRLAGPLRDMYLKYYFDEANKLTED